MEQVRAAEYRARQIAMQQMSTEQKQTAQAGGDGMYIYSYDSNRSAKQTDYTSKSLVLITTTTLFSNHSIVPILTLKYYFFMKGICSHPALNLNLKNSLD